MGSDEEYFVFHGTPIEREEEIASRKKKTVSGASGNLRTLPAWKQEVTDEEGWRRFHGAFTGGYSAEYYNTVGSKEGWAPQSFTSSRKNRAGARKQSISDFLDEDEKVELEGQTLSASSQFDTFGFTAAEISRKQAEKEQHERPSSIPGPVPDELVAPVSESIEVKPDTAKAASVSGASLSARQVFESQEPQKEASTEEPEVEVEVENVERPVDLYKAIFSDDSEDDEEQHMNGKRQEGQDKKNEAAATTLNRLIACDFLESLGKELGFEVPSDVAYPEGTKRREEDDKSKSKSEPSSEKIPDKSGLEEKAEEKTSSLTLGSEEEEKSRKKREKSPKKWSGGNDLSSSESSGDERRRKRSKKDRHRKK